MFDSYRIRCPEEAYVEEYHCEVVYRDYEYCETWCLCETRICPPSGAADSTCYGYDIELVIEPCKIILKIDSPSGTALKIGEVISEALDSDFNTIARFGRNKGPNKRLVGAKNEIGIHSIRAGDIIGDHIILYAGPGERIELKHQAHSRSCFATGAIKAVKFIAQAKENKIYTTNEVLGL